MRCKERLRPNFRAYFLLIEYYAKTVQLENSITSCAGGRITLILVSFILLLSDNLQKFAHHISRAVPYTLYQVLPQLCIHCMVEGDYISPIQSIFMLAWLFVTRIRKKLADPASKRKMNAVLCPWTLSITNNIYYVIEHSEGQRRGNW